MGVSLTKVSKERELARWEALKAGPRGKGGMGFPDDRIIPLCDEINTLTGVCTLQSCAGHPRSTKQKWSAPGQLWLWLDRRMFRAFIRQAPAFAKRAGIEEVRLLFGRYNDDRIVVDLLFHGDDKRRLKKSSTAILLFLRRL